MRAVALKEFTFYGSDGRPVTLKQGFADDIPDEHAGLWEASGLIAPTPPPASGPDFAALFIDDGRECWLALSDGGTSPRFRRQGSVAAIAGWMTVTWGIKPKQAIDLVALLYLLKVVAQ